MATIQEQYTELAKRLIDQAHDFATHLLDTERDFAKQLVATGTVAATKLRDSLAQTDQADRSASQN